MKKKAIFLLCMVVLMMSLFSGCSKKWNLDQAIYDGDYETVVKILEESKPNLNKNTLPKYLAMLMDTDALPPLHKACSKGYYNIAKVLVEAGADVNYCEEVTNTLPMTHILNSHFRDKLQIMKLLIDNGANIEDPRLKKENSKYSFFACIVSDDGSKDTEYEQEQYEFVFYLLDKGVSLDSGYLLKEAIYYNNFKIAKYAVEVLNADVNIIMESYAPGGDLVYSYLIEAVKMRYLSNNIIDVDTIKLLLDHGADVTFKDQDNKTALDYAKESGNQEVIELIQAKLDALE